MLPSWRKPAFAAPRVRPRSGYPFPGRASKVQLSWTTGTDLNVGFCATSRCPLWPISHVLAERLRNWVQTSEICQKVHWAQEFSGRVPARVEDEHLTTLDQAEHAVHSCQILVAICFIALGHRRVYIDCFTLCIGNSWPPACHCPKGTRHPFLSPVTKETGNDCLHRTALYIRTVVRATAIGWG